MTKLKRFSIAILACGITFAANAAQDTAKTDEPTMTPPKALENKVYDSMVGTWETNSEMGGKKVHNVLKVRWGLNHQFLIVELKSTGLDNPKIQYEGLGLFGVDAQGKAKTFWFDSWGADDMSNGVGTFGDNKLDMSYSNAMFKETRNFEIKGKEMITHAKGTITANGKETPFEQTAVYKKR